MDGFTRQAFELKISLGAKAVLLALSKHCGSKATCWPRIATICKFTGQSRATVFRRLKELEEVGLVERLAKYMDGRRIENTYTILPLVVNEQPNITSRRSHNEMGTVSNCDETEEGKVEADGIILPFPVSRIQKGVLSSKPGGQEKPKPSCNGHPPSLREQQFQDFWDAYPKKESKPFAREQFFRALNRASFEEIMDGLEIFNSNRKAAAEELKYCRLPARWLAGDDWDALEVGAFQVAAQ